MSLDILSSVKLEALSLEGKHLIGRSHSIRKREQGAYRYKEMRKAVLISKPKGKIVVKCKRVSKFGVNMNSLQGGGGAAGRIRQ